MTEIYSMAAAASPSRQEAERIYGQHPPLTREQATELLRSQGVVATADGKMSSAPREHVAADYAIPADSPVSAADLSRLRLDPVLAHLIVQDMQAKAPHPAAVEAHVSRAGASYKSLIGDVTALLASARVTKIKPASLTAHSLTMLAAVARHQAKLAARPK
jgi:hypothetical protein